MNPVSESPKKTYEAFRRRYRGFFAHSIALHKVGLSTSLSYSISDRARLVVIKLDYQTSFAYRAGMVIEYDKSTSSSVAQKQILIPKFSTCLKAFI